MAAPASSQSFSTECSSLPQAQSNQAPPHAKPSYDAGVQVCYPIHLLTPVGCATPSSTRQLRMLKFGFFKTRICIVAKVISLTRNECRFVRTMSTPFHWDDIYPTDLLLPAIANDPHYFVSALPKLDQRLTFFHCGMWIRFPGKPFSVKWPNAVSQNCLEFRVPVVTTTGVVVILSLRLVSIDLRTIQHVEQHSARHGQFEKCDSAPKAYCWDLHEPRIHQ